MTIPAPEPSPTRRTPNSNGPDSFTYLANDGVSDSNTATVSITVNPVDDAPVLGDNSFETADNTTLSASLTATDIDSAELAFSITADPNNGTLTLVDSSGAFTYTPDFGFIGVDAFGFEVTDGTTTVGGTATITVFDAVPDWLFIGFDNPWAPFVTINAGSAVPLKWHYADSATGQLVPSFTANLRITATGRVSCDPASAVVAELTLPEDAGSSDLRYNDGNWQLNWDTSGQPNGCYFLSIFHPTTNQLDMQNAQGETLAIFLR